MTMSVKIVTGKSYLMIYKISMCKNTLQMFSYSKTYNINYLKNALQKDVDPRVEALRDKLVFCDYLDSHKVKFGFIKRKEMIVTLKKLECAKEKYKILNEPVYSVFLDTVNNKTNDAMAENSDEASSIEKLETLEQDDEISVHMPYAHADKYELKDSEYESSSNFILHTQGPTIEKENKLNEKYKDLYEKYLEAKLSSPELDIKLGDYNNIQHDVPQTRLNDDLSKVAPNWMTDFEEFNDVLQKCSEIPYYGTAKADTEVSKVPCGGCGAMLHCKDVGIPGYLPSELFLKKSNQDLKAMICQRCHFMKDYNTALDVKVSTEEYPELLKVIKTKKCAVILMVDLTDFPCSIWPDIKSVLHPYTAIFIVGTKVDLLPKDSPNCYEHVKKCLANYVVQYTGINENYIKHVALISAKTGYGIEQLVNKLFFRWANKGDVYLIGCTNVGKSSLFNALLKSDYCKFQAADLIRNATISRWPGTTLNLLKFPILKLNPSRLRDRIHRLIEFRMEEHAEDEARLRKYKETHNAEKYATVKGYIGKTFAPTTFEMNPFTHQSKTNDTKKIGIDENDNVFKFGHWCYDTPGTVQRDQVINILTTNELMATLPQSIILPRTFNIRPYQTVFLAGIGRLDYINGDGSIRFTIFASTRLPITLCYTKDAEYVYKELLSTEAFVVPENNPKRLKLWPTLKSMDMEVTGIDNNISAADVVLSSAGWIAITPNANQHVELRAWTPEGRGLHLRTPALLKHSVRLHGPRIPTTPTFKKGWQIHVKNK